MRRRKVIIFAGVTIAVLFLCYSVRVAAVHAFHNDACLVIALLVADKTERGEMISDTELRSEMTRLIQGNVIHGRVDRQGSPTDLNGNTFVVQRRADVVTVSTRFSLLQPIKSRAQVDIKKHNRPGARNADCKDAFCTLTSLGATDMT